MQPEREATYFYTVYE